MPFYKRIVTNAQAPENICSYRQGTSHARIPTKKKDNKEFITKYSN